MNRTELKDVVRREIKGLSAYLEEEDYDNAVNSAERETGYAIPNTNNTEMRWLVERTKRHLLFMLWTESAHKFKYKQYNLQNRFAHYKDLIRKMDEDWEKFLEDSVFLLEGVAAFGSKIDAGFAYEDETGRDTTYLDDNEVVINPGEADI